MKRRLIATWLAALSVGDFATHAQEGVLKPFRPEGAPQPASEIPKGIPTKPAKPIGDSAEEVPKGVPINRPSVVPAPVPATRPMTTPEPEGDIVIRPGGTPTSPDQVQLQYADGFFARKMYQDATQEYQRYLDQFPRTAAADRQAAYYRLAESYRNTGSLNNAKSNYETLLSSYPDGEFVGYAAYRLGTILYEEKDYRSALPVYRRASVRLRQPTLIVASKFFVGRCLEATGQKTEARAAYDAFVALPIHQRLLALNVPDPEVEWFVAWRLRALAKL